MTMGNMFCGYACVVYAMRGEYESIVAAGFAIFRLIAQYFPIFEAHSPETAPAKVEEQEADLVAAD